jgi:hypothetical protein
MKKYNNSFQQTTISVTFFAEGKKTATYGSR